jgi:hypothetical protein
MFDRNEPLYLQSRLEDFICRWHGHRKPWYGIAPEKLAMTELPQPLKWLYGFVGEWDGRYYWKTLLGNQDCLLPFEELEISNGKLVFVNENQGVWQVGTETCGDDPPVWVRIDDGEWKLLDESLTMFLVTFVLHETVFGCRHLASGEDIIAQASASGMHVAPLWLNHPYPAAIKDTGVRSTSFYAANGNYLIMDDWCATNESSPWETLPTIFKASDDPPPSSGFSAYDPIPNHIRIPSFVKASHLKNLIRRHEEEAEFHHEKSKLFQRLLAELNTSDSN